MVRIDWFAQGWRTYSYADVGHTTVTLGETLDVLADFNSNSHSFMAGDELLKTEDERMQNGKGDRRSNLKKE